MPQVGSVSMKICLFGSGSKDIDKKYLNLGYQLGKRIADHNHSLVFGGGNDGMMGSVARGCYDNKGQIIGIIPEWMDEFEELFDKCDEIVYTKTMNERKLKFIEISDLFIISPGGIGTLDEFFEVWTLKKVKSHKKPIIILNFNHFYDKLLDMFDELIELGFISKKDKMMFIVTTNIEETINVIKD